MSGAPLAIRGLRVVHPGPPPAQALDGLDLEVIAGECLGILGESGSGKSTLARALLGLIPEARREGEARLGDLDLLRLDEAGWRPIRWRQIALGFQSTASLNPVLRVLDQVTEPLRIQLGFGRTAAVERAESVLAEVGLDLETARRYPSELSGGQRRLALLATAAVCEPDVLLLDEPTAGLDPVTRERVTAYLTRLRVRRRMTLVLLGHDIDLVRALADRVGVLYRGWLAEIGPTDAVLGDARHPLTRGLLDAHPSLGSVRELRGIRGRAPGATVIAAGCPFVERCTQALEECASARPVLVPPTGENDGRLVSCLRGGLVELLRAERLRKSYTPRALGRRGVQAVDGIDFSVREGEVVGIAGSTGAGKSTLGMLLAGLLQPDEGSVRVDGLDLSDRAERKAAQRRLQLVFQDPFEALSARLTVLAAVREPLDVQRRADGGDAVGLVRQAIAAVRLPSDDTFLARHTHELSGGELQRVSLARALVLEPKLLVLDEPVAMLDPSEQAEALQLLKGLQVERGLSMVLISHDLATLLRIADRVLVLERGRVVEEQPSPDLFAAPRHPATRALLSASGRDALIARILEPEPSVPVPIPQEVVS